MDLNSNDNNDNDNDNNDDNNNPEEEQTETKNNSTTLDPEVVAELELQSIKDEGWEEVKRRPRNEMHDVKLASHEARGKPGAADGIVD